MFNEYSCGCIVSVFQGRVRICMTHRPDKATGDGAFWTMNKMPRIVRQYPANGEMPDGWR
jgi:hypothetical protein